MGELPSGVVTFVITDLEGSTRLYRRLGAEYPALIAEHDRLLAEAVRRHAGVVVSPTGDGVFATFDDVGAAVAAAAEMQRAIAGHTWPDGVEPLIRIGLHCGVASRQNGRWVALAAHHAARVTSAAYGGQVLGTAEVVDAVPHPRDGTWADLGAYRLKDFDEPVRLFELRVDGIAGHTAGGTRATPAAAHNVPEVASSFLGRQAELRELVALLADGRRLVTVLGPGGVGKTRLAFEAVKAVAPGCEHGAWVVLLANIALAGDLDDRLLRTLAIPERLNVPPRETLLATLAERHTLLLLDNTEHLNADVARLVRQMLDRCPHLTILVTSRQPLRLAGEVEWRLPPLPVGTEGSDDTAVELFMQRASARNPAALVDPGAREIIAGICRRLDGLPLAIELAAGRLRHMTVRDLADRLHTELNLDAAADRDLDDRQRTLSALVDWSFQLLTGPGQTMLRRVSVLQGPASLQAVEALADTPTEAALGIAELVDNSLVAFDGGADWPYRMLVTIREFARQKLGDGAEALETRRRHAAHHLRLARGILAGLDGPDALRHLAIADRAHDDLTAAIAFAEADGDGDLLGELAYILARCLYNRGRFTEGRDCLLRAERLPSSPSIRARVLTYGGYLLCVQGDTERGRRWCSDGVDLVAAIDDRDLVADARRRFAIVLLMCDDFAEAKRQLEMALTEPATPLRVGQLLEVRGLVAQREGDVESAIRDYDRACASHRTIGWMIGLPNTLDNLGAALVQVGRLDEAEAVLSEALERTPATETATISHIYLHIGQLCQARGEIRDAAGWAAKALALAEQDGHAWAIREIEESGLVGDPLEAPAR